MMKVCVPIALVVVVAVSCSEAVQRSSPLLSILSRRSVDSLREMDVRAATPTTEGCHTADGRVVPLWGEVSRQGCHYEMCGPMGLLLPAHDCTLAPPAPIHPTTAGADLSTSPVTV